MRGGGSGVFVGTVVVSRGEIDFDGMAGAGCDAEVEGGSPSEVGGEGLSPSEVSGEGVSPSQVDGLSFVEREGVSPSGIGASVEGVLPSVVVDNGLMDGMLLRCNRSAILINAFRAESGDVGMIVVGV